jgi:hypothetical protein
MSDDPGKTNVIGMIRRLLAPAATWREVVPNVVLHLDAIRQARRVRRRAVFAQLLEASLEREERELRARGLLIDDDEGRAMRAREKRRAPGPICKYRNDGVCRREPRCYRVCQVVRRDYDFWRLGR